MPPASPTPPKSAGPGGSLWPSDLLAQPVRIPQGMLEVQAEHLRSMVGGELLVDVRSTVDPRTGVASHRFVLRIRALEGYEYELLRVSHPLSRVYPCGLRCDPVGLTVSHEDDRAIQEDRALEATLANIFKANDVQSAVRSMHAQAQVEGERAKNKRGRRTADSEPKR